MDFTTGDILEADVEAIVNTVNCVGFMGRGIAAQFRKRFPANFKAYAAACDRSELAPGKMFIFETGRLTNPRYIVNFPTKRHWRGKSRIEDIASGLKALVDDVRRLNIRSIGIPPLGCGLGGLNWRDVRPLIERSFAPLADVQVVVFEPKAVGDAPMTTLPQKAATMTPGRAVLVALMHRYLGGLMDTAISLLEVHKLMYFAQEAGQPLRLRYVKATYGPYAENLRHVLSEVEGSFITGYGDGGDAPDKVLELVPGAVSDAERLLQSDPLVAQRFARVAKLVEGFETSFGMELLATVHWVSRYDQPRTEDSLVTAVHAWNTRKNMFKREQIRIAASRLEQGGWLADTADLSRT